MSEQKSSCQTRQRYKTDVTDEQWSLIEGLIPAAVAKTGRKPTDVREILNTILYQDHTGCQWDMLPHDLCARSTTFDYYKAWQDNGVWERILDTLRVQVRLVTPRIIEAEAAVEVSAPVEVQPDASVPVCVPREASVPGEVQADASVPVCVPSEVSASVCVKPQERPRVETQREATPSFVIMDSQSAKTTEVGGEQRGYDGGKKVKGRKRHIAVDTLGLLCAVVVTAANISDGKGACQLLEKLTPEKFPRLKGACGDGRYNDKAFIARLQKRHLSLEVKTRPPGSKGFILLKKRWIVERTFAWLGFNRRLSKDYERTVASSETRVRTAAIAMMLRRLTTKK